MSIGVVHQDVSRLQISVDEAASMDFGKDGRDADSELEELRHLNRRSEMPIERRSAGILKDQHLVIAIANELQRPGRPFTLQVIL